MIIIYKHTNKITNKSYVGQTKNSTIRRWGTDGFRYLRKNKNNKYHHPKFASAIKKYGWEIFTHEILLECENKIYADYCEKYIISIYNTVKNGYNVLKGGEDNPIKRGVNHHFYNKTFSEAHKRKLSENHADFRKSKHPKAKKVILINLLDGSEILFNSIIEVENHKQGWKYSNIKLAYRKGNKFYKHYMLKEYKGEKITLAERRDNNAAEA